jgi:hypothetical protein
MLAYQALDLTREKIKHEGKKGQKYVPAISLNLTRDEE